MPGHCVSKQDAWSFGHTPTSSAVMSMDVQAHEGKADDPG